MKTPALHIYLVETAIALERLQQNLAAHNAQVGDQSLRVQVGLAHFDPERPCSFEELVARADTAMMDRRFSRG
ncbi:MAG: hypothetical protein IT369_01045 [Candidatus Latescibacteria bacterium]|nr:hypothetical protein [Candidatus Latescibacterota bacterium]